MSNIICKKCGSIFKKNNSLQYHISNNVCQKTIKIYACNLCKEVFSTNSCLKYHTDNKVCIKRNTRNYEKNLNILIFKKMQQLEADLIKIKENTLHNTNSNTYTLVKFGSEDLSKLKTDDVQYVLNKGFNAINALVERVHFNPNFPENHNVRFSNLKDKYGMIYDGEDWVTKYKSDIIKQLVENKGVFIKKEIESNLHITIHKNLKDAALRRMTVGPDNDDVIKAEEDLKLLIYNKRNKMH